MKGNSLTTYKQCGFLRKMTVLSEKVILPFSCLLHSHGFLSEGKNLHSQEQFFLLTILHSERPKLYTILVFLSAIQLKGLYFRRASSSSEANRSHESTKEVPICKNSGNVSRHLKFKIIHFVYRVNFKKDLVIQYSWK